MVGEAKAQVDGISPDDASTEIASGQAVVLDVREPVEWEQHIEGAVQVPRGLLSSPPIPQAPATSPSWTPPAA